jgi:hypothetical protein
MLARRQGGREQMAEYGDPFEEFIVQSQIKRDRLLGELASYHPLGVMRLWTGRSADHLNDVTAERVEQIGREIARIEATIQFTRKLQQEL